MKNNVLTIMRKEFARFFKDPRMVITTIIMPGLILYLMYSFMGVGFSKQMSTSDDYVYRIAAVNLPESIEEYTAEISYVDISSESDEDAAMAKLDSDEIDLVAVFPSMFDQMMYSWYDGEVPNVQLFYNSSRVASSEAYTNMKNILDYYERSLTNKFDVNRTSEDTKYDTATVKDTTSQLLSMMLPMLLMIFLFSGCMAVAPESIAGEKERGTIATLLVTPMKRSELAIGKILSLSVISLLSGTSSFIGMMLSIPKLMQGTGRMDTSAYGFSDYMLIMAVILSTILVIISIISIVSAFSKTVKEASTAALPLMLISMAFGVTSMFGNGAPTNPLFYLIPIYNSVQCMTGVFSLSYSTANIITTLCSNVSVALILMIILAKMFNSEKIMFSK